MANGCENHYSIVHCIICIGNNLEVKYSLWIEIESINKKLTAQKQSQNDVVLGSKRWSLLASNDLLTDSYRI